MPDKYVEWAKQIIRDEEIKEISEQEYQWLQKRLNDERIYRYVLQRLKEDGYVLSGGRENSQRLKALERVAEAAKDWRETRNGGEWSFEGGVRDAVAVLQTMMAREQALIHAVNALEELERGDDEK